MALFGLDGLGGRPFHSYFFKQIPQIQTQVFVFRYRSPPKKAFADTDQRAGKPGYTGYTGNTMLCQVYSRYTVGIQGCIQVGGIQGYTGKPGTPTILKHGVYRGYTAQRVYRGYTARIPGIALCVYRWGIQVGCQPSGVER